MSSTSETGHAKNVANFQTIITYVTGYGATYNPTNPNIQLPQLQLKHTAANTAVNDVNAEVASQTNLINLRQMKFDPLSKLATRIINALDASGVAPQVVADARTLVNALTGKRKSPKPDPADPNAPATASASHMSFDMRLDNFNKLIELLSTQPLYAPNETELRTTSLTTLYDTMLNANNDVKVADTKTSNARILRNEELYHPETGLVNTALDVKKYIKALFGADSPQYKQVSAIKFTSPKE
jgi:hypothetical protein